VRDEDNERLPAVIEKAPAVDPTLAEGNTPLMPKSFIVVREKRCPSRRHDP
jgi:hypothetical protein